MQSFKQYMKELEELEIAKVEDNKNTKLADFIRTIEDLNDEKFRRFAIDELGMSEEEAESIVYKMLRDFLLKYDKNENGEADDLDLGDSDEYSDDDISITSEGREDYNTTNDYNLNRVGIDGVGRIIVSWLANRFNTSIDDIDARFELEVTALENAIFDLNRKLKKEQ